jgi:hypothetical protein
LQLVRAGVQDNARVIDEAHAYPIDNPTVLLRKYLPHKFPSESHRRGPPPSPRACTARIRHQLNCEQGDSHRAVLNSMLFLFSDVVPSDARFYGTNDLSQLSNRVGDVCGVSERRNS